MKRYYIIIIAVLSLMSFRKAEKAVSMLGKEIPSFTLPAAEGGMFSLADYDTAKGIIIVFTCNHCPFAKLYTDRLNALSDRFRSLGVPLVAINPMDSLLYASETREEMTRFAASMHYHFPYLQDYTQQVAAGFHATHTPQAFVIWRESGKWIVRYQGAIDDNGQHPELATPFVAQAVEALLQHQLPPHGERLSLGCAINYRK